jgi:hypothetical protein
MDHVSGIRVSFSGFGIFIRDQDVAAALEMVLSNHSGSWTNEAETAPVLGQLKRYAETLGR